MPITDWPEDERPREKLLRKGAQALSDAELLAIFLRVGVAGKSAVELARDLLAHFGGLTPLFAAPLDAFAAFPGMGPAKYAQLQAVLEMSKRALAEDMRQRDVLGSPAAVREYLRLQLAGRPHEVFMAVFLDAQNRVLAVEELFRGTLTETRVYPREVVKRALAHNAGGLILAHNHPSGLLQPSEADRRLTIELKNALALIDVRVLDHFLIAGNRSLSFAEQGYL